MLISSLFQSANVFGVAEPQLTWWSWYVFGDQTPFGGVGLAFKFHVNCTLI